MDLLSFCIKGLKYIWIHLQVLQVTWGHSPAKWPLVSWGFELKYTYIYKTKGVVGWDSLHKHKQHTHTQPQRRERKHQSGLEPSGASCSATISPIQSTQNLVMIMKMMMPLCVTVEAILNSLSFKWSLVKINRSVTIFRHPITHTAYVFLSFSCRRLSQEYWLILGRFGWILTADSSCASMSAAPLTCATLFWLHNKTYTDK